MVQRGQVQRVVPVFLHFLDKTRSESKKKLDKINYNQVRISLNEILRLWFAQIYERRGGGN